VNKEVEENIKSQAMDIILNIAKQAQKDLEREDAIIETDGVLEKIPYTTEVIENEDSVEIVPTFDNRVDEFSNSKIIAENGFEGNMTLTKLRNKITQ